VEQFLLFIVTAGAVTWQMSPVSCAKDPLVFSSARPVAVTGAVRQEYETQHTGRIWAGERLSAPLVCSVLLGACSFLIPA
jgi:hypothetical protein